MKNKNNLLLLFIPLGISAVLYILNYLVGPLTRGNPIGLFGNTSSIWFTIIPGGIGLCGLFLCLVTVPILFRKSFVNWKNSIGYWIGTSILAVIAGALGLIFNGPLGYVALATIPICILVMILTLLITIIAGLITNYRSTYSYIHLLILIIPVGAIFLFLNLVKDCCH